VGDWNTILRI